MKNPFCLLVLVLGLALLSACASTGRGPAAVDRPAAGIVVFTSDFSTVDDAVAICKGAMLGVDRNLRIVDVTHQIQPFNIRDAARLMANLTKYYPAGTAFVTVVDPGVGSERKAIVAKTKKGHYFVLPDNGLITFVADNDGLEAVREITNPAWMLQSRTSSTFHGRDIFSPVAARLARGEDWTQVGPTIGPPLRLDVQRVTRTNQGLVGEVVALDGQYGNLITNIPFSEVAKLGYEFGDMMTVTVGKKKVTVKVNKFFAGVAVGKPILYSDSNELVALAVNMGNFSQVYGIKPPSGVQLPSKPAKGK